MKRHVHGGHVKWIVKSFYHIISEKSFVLFWMKLNIKNLLVYNTVWER